MKRINKNAQAALQVIPVVNPQIPLFNVRRASTAWDSLTVVKNVRAVISVQDQIRNLNFALQPCTQLKVNPSALSAKMELLVLSSTQKMVMFVPQDSSELTMVALQFVRTALLVTGVPLLHQCL